MGSGQTEERGRRELARHLTGGGCPSHEEVKARKGVAEPPGKLYALPGQQLDTTCEQGSRLRRPRPGAPAPARTSHSTPHGQGRAAPGAEKHRLRRPRRCPRSEMLREAALPPRPQPRPPAGTPGSCPPPLLAPCRPSCPAGARSPLRTPQTLPQASWGPSLVRAFRAWDPSVCSCCRTPRPIRVPAALLGL